MPQANVKLNSGGNPNQQQNEGFVENITNTVSDLASQGAEFVQNAVGDLPNRVSELASQGAEFAQGIPGNLTNLSTRGTEMLETRLSSLEDGFNTIVREWDEEKSITAGAAGIAAIGLVLGSKVDKKWFALSAIAGGLYAAHKYSNGAAIPAIKKLAGDLGGGLGFGGTQRGGTRIHENSNLRPSDISSLDRTGGNQGGSQNAGNRSQGGNQGGGSQNTGGMNQGQSNMSTGGGMNNQSGSQRNQGNGGNSNTNRGPM